MGRRKSVSTLVADEGALLLLSGWQQLCKGAAVLLVPMLLQWLPGNNAVAWWVLWLGPPAAAYALRALPPTLDRRC